MIYEDILHLWLSFLLYLIFSDYKTSLSPSFCLFILLLKEVLFFVFLPFFKKRVSPFLFLILIYLLFFIDITILGVGNFLNRIILGDVLIIFWFLHYYLLYRKLYYTFHKEQLKIFFGLLIPFVVFLILQDLLQFLEISFIKSLLIFILIILVLGPALVKRIWPVEPLTDPFYNAIISSFFEIHKVKIKKPYLVIKTNRPFYTAGILGVVYPFRYFFISKDLLYVLTIKDLLGVIAHEIGHIKKHHIFWLILVLLNFPLFLSIISFFLIFFFDLSSIWVAIFLAAVGFVYLRYIFAYFLRSFEREADFCSYEILGFCEPLVSALFKIGMLTGQTHKKSWHHYGIMERIEFLRNIQGKEKLWKKFFRKLKIIIITWFVIDALILGSIFYVFLS